MDRGLWLPGQRLDSPPTYTPEVLLTSSFAQELYITVPANTLFHSPGIYMLQVGHYTAAGSSTGHKSRPH